MQAFDTFGVVPPGFGIVHQVNLEYLARGVHKSAAARRASLRVLPRLAGRHRQPHDDDQRHRRRRLGRRRHRGRSGDARPAGLLPDARRRRLRVHRAPARRRDRDRPGAHRDRDPAQARRSSASSSSSSARARESLSVPDRATMANMAPEYGATMGFFPVDDKTDRVLRGHRAHERARSSSSRPTSRRRACTACRAPGRSTTRRWSSSTWATVTPSLAGPKRPQDRIEIGQRQGAVHVALQQAACRERLQPAGRAPADAPSRAPGGDAERRALRRRRCREGPAHALGPARSAALPRRDERQQADAGVGRPRSAAENPGGSLTARSATATC